MSHHKASEGSKRIWITDFFPSSKKPRVSKSSAESPGSASKIGTRPGVEKLSKTETVPSTTETVPSTTETVPSKTETVPSTTETVPSTAETVPSKTETVPSKRDMDASQMEPEGSKTGAGMPKKVNGIDVTGNPKETGYLEDPESLGSESLEAPKNPEDSGNLDSENLKDIHASEGNAIETKDYAEFCRKHNFDKQKWVSELTDEQRSLLSLEIATLHITWLVFLHRELTKPYFLKLKRFLRAQTGKTIFPPARDVYSWSHYTPLPEVKCLIMGQDPYHNHSQAHGLAFSVLEPTRPPPSLVNIYKALHMDFPAFEVPDPKALAQKGTPGGGNLTQWAQRGVLMLNACLTVEAHRANSHANQGWETFTEKVIHSAILYHQHDGFVIMAWGSPAQKRVAGFSSLLKNDFCVIKSVHPSPLSAHRGFFDAHVFQKCNDWLRERNKSPIDWGIVPGNSVS